MLETFMVVADSSVLIEFLNGRSSPQTTWIQQAGHSRRIAVTSLILCEVLRGVRDQQDLDRVRRALGKFHVFENVGSELAVAAAENFRHLRTRGITVRGTIDCLTATFCIQSGHELLHNDRDFDAFEQHLGLQVLHPPEIPIN
jgi:predicted nucleic acid-binding protein